MVAAQHVSGATLVYQHTTIARTTEQTILSVSIQDVIGLAIASLAMIIVRIIIAQIPARHILDVLGMDRVPQTPVAKCVRISHRIVIKSTTA